MRLGMKLQLKVGKLGFICGLAGILISSGYLLASNSAHPTAPAATAQFQNPTQDPGLMAGMRQLTFQGPRAGEGYFSRDGKKMIFQSERQSDNPFYQIFLMDMNSGKINRVSTGSGKTTCAWIHPTQKKVMFASTHLDPQFKQKIQQELEARHSSQKGKYSWSYDEYFDIFETDWNGKNIKRLTKEKGYDAEGDYSPDGKKIVFASNRTGYTETLTPEDKKIFEQDPSYMMEIYVMNADGTGVKRLTDAKGYDGGPFFSADGKKITWRRFTPNGQSAEVYVMNADGSEQKAITKLGAMSWAPYFHPSGDYLVFTTNVLGFSNFELFIVDAKGEKDPVRVSYLDGFDGLPVFTPDGNKISWTRKNEKGESQIYMADWNDAKARELLGLEAKAPEAKTLASSEINTTDLKSWVSYLASEALAGRATGSVQEAVYTQKLAQAFREMGLVPAEGNDFLIPYTFTSGVALGAANKLTLKDEKKEFNFRVEEDFIPLSFSKTGGFESAGIVFAGYGIKAAATDKQPAYDSYKNLDVKGRWVLAFRDIPEDVANERRIFLNTYARLQHKALVAKNEGAAGLLIVSGPKSASSKLIKLRYDGAGSEATSIPVLNISQSTAEALIQPTGKKLKEWQELNDKGEVQTANIEKLSLSAQVELQFQKSQGHNVVAKLPVKGAKTSVMFGAHGDHLGHGEQGNSLAKNEENGKIHYGADDNASGVAAVMEIAKSLSHRKKAGKLSGVRQNLLFAVWTGEESGLLGSTNYLRERKGEKISSYLNMDMIGRLREQLLVQGVGSAIEWRGYLEQLAAQSDVSLSAQDDPYVPSDGMQFYVQGIPSVTFFTGSHAEYHSPRDRVETINFTGLKKIAELVQTLGVGLASQSEGLHYLKAESSQRKLEGRGFRIYLGTIPDYTQEGVKGVKISGTSKDSPAEKAGLKPGDVILELDHTKIESLYDYVYCLQAMKANVETMMKVSRQGQILDLKIVPGLKE